MLASLLFVLASSLRAIIGVGLDMSCFRKTDGFYPNPTSCEEYYVCTSDRLHRFTCQTGQLFNPRTGSCDKSQNVQCHVVRPAVTQTSHQLGGSFCLGKPDNFYPSPDSCDHYYICANQSAIQATCPYGLLYSPTKQNCDLRSRVSCLPGQTVPPYTTRALPSRWLKPTTATSKPTQLPAFTSSGKPAISTLPATTLNPGTTYSSICRNQSNSLMAAPGTCRKYIQCYYQMAVARTCPTGTAFNKMIQACNFPYKVPGCH